MQPDSRAETPAAESESAGVRSATEEAGGEGSLSEGGAAATSQRARLESELERLRALRADLDRDWARIRYLALGLPALALLYWRYGLGGVLVGLLGLLSLAATMVYLITVRRREYTGDIAQVEEDLETLRWLAVRPGVE